MDECHQLIKDVDYRNFIVLPMADFFRFKNKAMVSATPLGFSDPRLKKFETREVCADYDYQQDITVINTYNTTKAIGEYLEKHQNGIICFFVNSVTQIYSIMKHFKLLEDSTVYCAPKSVTKLKEGYDFTNAYKEWSAETMKKYNFFTGRFFSAFDIELTYKPDLVIITDPYISQYTMLDVDTDCIQICGRFRKGINSATHIYRVNPEICAKSKEQKLQEIHDLEEGCYRRLQLLLRRRNEGTGEPWLGAGILPRRRRTLFGTSRLADDGPHIDGSRKCQEPADGRPLLRHHPRPRAGLHEGLGDSGPGAGHPLQDTSQRGGPQPV